MSYKIDWIRVEDELPIVDSARPLWLMTNEGVIQGRLIPDPPRTYLWDSEVYFMWVSHWAYQVTPDPPHDHRAEEFGLRLNEWQVRRIKEREAG